jgi:hypothetical protein
MSATGGVGKSGRVDDEERLTSLAFVGAIPKREKPRSHDQFQSATEFSGSSSSALKSPIQTVMPPTRELHAFSPEGRW